MVPQKKEKKLKKTLDKSENLCYNKGTKGKEKEIKKMKFTLTITPTFDVHTVVINHNCCVEKLSNDRFVDYIINDEISSFLDYAFDDDEWSINDDDRNKIRQALIDECYRLGRIKNDDPFFMI